MSARLGDGEFLITPTATPYDKLDADDLAQMSILGSCVMRGGVPSTEWRLHHAIYESRPEVQAVVHAHPVYASALSCLRLDIPAFHYMIAAAGGDSIRCAPYALFGSQALARYTLDALRDRKACLMANPEIVPVGG